MGGIEREWEIENTKSESETEMDRKTEEEKNALPWTSRDLEYTVSTVN